RHLCGSGRSHLSDRRAGAECASGDRDQRHGRLDRLRHRRACDRGSFRDEGGGGGMSFPVKAVVFDWAGTMIDFGCMAPVDALKDVFATEGVTISVAEARRDMGKAKLDHLRALLAEPQVAARWRSLKGSDASEGDVERLYRKLEPAMKAAATQSSRLIPGAAETAAELRALGVRIGSGTGYTREMMADILPSAAAQR